MAVKSLAQSSLVEPFSTNSMLAGYSGNAFHHLETVRLSSTTLSIVFNNLERYADFQHLQLRTVTKGAPTNNDFLFAKLNLNGDTGANYNQHLLGGNGSIVSSSSTTYSFLIAGIPQNSNTSGDFCATTVDILDAFSSDKFTTTRTLTGIVGSYNRIFYYSGLWRNTAPVSSFTISHETTGFSAGSRFSLYGIKARA